MTAPAAVAALTAEDARRLTARIRDALAVADGLLVQAWRGRAWEALGHGSWDAYVAAELPELRMLRLSPTDRRERVAALRAEGMSTRAIASSYGIGAGTAARDAAAVDAPAEVVSLDGRRRAARSTRTTPEPARQETRAEQVVRLVAAAGDAGLTSPEVMKRARCSYGAASGVLSRLARQGRVQYAATVVRAGYSAYIVDPSCGRSVVADCATPGETVG